MSVVFYYKEFNDHDLGDDNSHLRNKFNAIIKDLEENEYTSLGDTKLISGNGSTKYFRAKLSNKDRLLFTSIRHNDKDVFVILEVILNHDYHKSNFLTKKIKNQEIEIIDKNSKDVSDNADIVGLEDASQVHLLGKLVTFSATQEEIIKRIGECKLPLVISGSAGSGKTSVALESLKKMQEKFEGGKILYITKSENLIKESKKLLECKYYDEIKTDVPKEIEFLSLHEFLKKISKEDVEEKKPISRSKFFSWFNEVCTKGKFKKYKKEGDKIFEEFTAVIGGRGRKEYEELGNRQAIFSKERRNNIYSLFEEYKKFIEEDQEYYDPNLVAHRCSEEEIMAYDAVVVDEVQDLTKSILDLILWK
ncbi:MAG: hypothetical protein PG978_001211 [Wolbachia endosymbiont of Ctenocephalides felis wCfeF]|nr:MAG: hypothetical protein PG978_001211 [Wolbachia endosymbiont of Ctenocephalides felis wCfeF]